MMTFTNFSMLAPGVAPPVIATLDAAGVWLALAAAATVALVAILLPTLLRRRISSQRAALRASRRSHLAVVRPIRVAR